MMKMNIAEIIVDIPNAQVNRPFYYAIPTHLSNQVKKGSRVFVPFGTRLVQGIVISINIETAYSGKIREITSVLDDEPVLSEELLKLGEWMANHYFTFKTYVYEAMLPNALKSTYTKIFDWTQNPLDEALNLPKTFKQAEKDGTLKQLLDLNKEGWVKLFTKVEDQKHIKKQLFIRPTQSFNTYIKILEELAPRYRAQKRLIQALIDIVQSKHVKEMAQVDLIKTYDLSTAVIKKAAEKEWVTLFEKEVYRDPYKHYNGEIEQPFQLTEQQQKAFLPVKKALDTNQSIPFLLHGVTGSGKTELYLQWIQIVLKQNKTALMLVPEIALTPQMTQRFKRRFGNEVAVLHSGLSNGERFDEWRKISRGEAKVVVGARSSIFAPLKDIGIIILDEEHEASYQQSVNPHYHARDIALWRSRYHQCPVILGSATPSLESRARALKGVYHYLELTKRPTSYQLPKIELVDMRNEVMASSGHFSRALKTAIETRLNKQEQIVLLLNRRGYSSYVQCRTCGYVDMCPNCDISLTLHASDQSMKCHYCGHTTPIKRTCPSCQSKKMRTVGAGTQQIEKEIEQYFPSARTIRMDVDTTRRKGQHETLLKQFEAGEADILLGTQMIAKGLDYPNVTLVGVINADTSLNLPDFRAYEQTYQLLTQVSGRAGRGEKAGQVIIQTYNPDHYTIQTVKNQDYEGFFKREMHLRHQGDYPPYYYMTKLTISCPDESMALKEGYRIKKMIEQAKGNQTIVLGPSPQSVARINRVYYYQILVKYKELGGLDQILDEIAFSSQKHARKKLFIDIERNPQQFV
ncbi:primosomal protein N' [Atopobacter phocae]|uniref:primosomal protein N' n=1 Tax=Atopobacter phocae TaxID=136492 RepID=UPI0004AFC382|nr:primosomal protein N' [Atopobacter phocae]